MNKKLLYMLFVLVIGGAFFCLFPCAIHAQGTLSPKEIVTRAIQERAKANAEAEKPREEVSGLIALFGKEAEAAGMSNLEIVQIYEQAYKAAQVPPDPIKDLLKNFFKLKNLGWMAAIILFLLLLLRNLAFTYAVQGLRDIPYRPVPLLFELNKMNYEDIPLVEQLAKVLEQNNFPGAKRFLTSFLKRGQMLLLFDGLDEVSSKEREQAVRCIKDLLATYPDCRAVITCRTVVYKEQFVDSADRHLEIIEFNDQQIQHFLSAWEPDMPGDKSIEHFLRTLRERPRIMALARNPLLLTMTAYLYTNTNFVLPHSRAEFYSESIKQLLDKWKEKRNRYKGIYKSLVLRHLALFNQLQEGTNRRNIELPVILAQIRTVLPSLTLKDGDAQPLLDEIVERSGLLLSIDGGAQYQFTHLTLQEYFAARALKDAPDTLIGYFKKIRIPGVR